jgi:hypothetical protein
MPSLRPGHSLYISKSITKHIDQQTLLSSLNIKSFFKPPKPYQQRPNFYPNQLNLFLPSHEKDHSSQLDSNKKEKPQLNSSQKLNKSVT